MKADSKQDCRSRKNPNDLVEMLKSISRGMTNWLAKYCTVYDTSDSE